MMGTESLGIILLIIPFIGAESRDSLQSALTALNQREKVLFSYPNYGNSDSSLLQFQSKVGREPTKLAILTSENYNGDRKSNDEIEQKLLDYFSDRGWLNTFKSNDENSPFRERNTINPDEFVSRKIYSNSDNEDSDILKLYKNYYKKYARNGSGYDSTNKRSYNTLGWNSIGMTKRADYKNPSLGNGFHSLYLPKTHENFAINEDEYIKNKLHYSPKHFSINKRSSDVPVFNLRLSNKNKRTSIKENKTDPRIEQELATIFNSKPKDTSLPQKTALPLEKGNVQTPNYMPIDIKKKSIDWSDYFGLDRRKKSVNGLDNEWLLERYHKTISLETKRSADRHQLHKHKELKRDISGKEQEHDDVLEKINEKIESMEEAIIDETLKFTGAHEESVDSKDIQKIKDHIIARLAAAYSLEKMRRAIDEYKESLGKDAKHAEDTKIIEEEKRFSVPRKEATLSHHSNDKNLPGDNDIKCAHANKDCYEQNYKPPFDLLETYNYGDCVNIEIACNELIIVYGDIGRIMQPACKMYQFCSLCDENEWFIPSRQCNGLFLSKADLSCGGDFKCQQISEQILKHVQRIYKSLSMESNEECSLHCPDRR